MAKRGLKTVTGKHGGDSYFYSTFSLCDMVEVSATRYAMLTETPSGVVAAGRLDPRFANDPDFPNQWRPITKDALGEPVLGAKHPYSGTGFYLQVTRLGEPADAIFFEFHAAFNEPEGWFDGAATLRSRLPTIIKFKVEQFRDKLARASRDAEKKEGKAAGGGGKAADAAAKADRGAAAGWMPTTRWAALGGGLALAVAIALLIACVRLLARARTLARQPAGLAAK